MLVGGRVVHLSPAVAAAFAPPPVAVAAPPPPPPVVAAPPPPPPPPPPPAGPLQAVTAALSTIANSNWRHSHLLRVLAFFATLVAVGRLIHPNAAAVLLLVATAALFFMPSSFGGPRAPGSLSAYSIFNDNMERLPGTLTAGNFVAPPAGGMALGGGGAGGGGGGGGAMGGGGGGAMGGGAAGGGAGDFADEDEEERYVCYSGRRRSIVTARTPHTHHMHNAQATE